MISVISPEYIKALKLVFLISDMQYFVKPLIIAENGSNYEFHLKINHLVEKF